MMRHDAIDDEEFTDTMFWAELHGIRNVEFRTIRGWIETEGYKIDPLPSDDALPASLRTLRDRLASLNIMVHFTDHLSDRELYEYLIDPERLDGHMARLPNRFIHFDVLGGGSDEDNELYLRFYATNEERASWLEDFPDYVLPHREPCPYARDQH